MIDHAFAEQARIRQIEEMILSADEVTLEHVMQCIKLRLEQLRAQSASQGKLSSWRGRTW